jgi:hypothetical protein
MTVKKLPNARPIPKYSRNVTELVFLSETQINPPAVIWIVRIDDILIASKVLIPAKSVKKKKEKKVVEAAMNCENSGNFTRFNSKR